MKCWVTSLEDLPPSSLRHHLTAYKSLPSTSLTLPQPPPTTPNHLQPPSTTLNHPHPPSTTLPSLTLPQQHRWVSEEDLDEIMSTYDSSGKGGLTFNE